MGSPARMKLFLRNQLITSQFAIMQYFLFRWFIAAQRCDLIGMVNLGVIMQEWPTPNKSSTFCVEPDTLKQPSTLHVYAVFWLIRPVSLSRSVSLHGFHIHW